MKEVRLKLGLRGAINVEAICELFALVTFYGRQPKDIFCNFRVNLQLIMPKEERSSWLSLCGDDWGRKPRTSQTILIWWDQSIRFTVFAFIPINSSTFSFASWKRLSRIFQLLSRNAFPFANNKTFQSHTIAFM